MVATLKIYDLITASVFILNIFVAGIFFIKNFKVSLTHKLISCILFLLLIRTFSIHLYLSKEIINFPHFLLLSHLVSRIGLPIIFLMLVFEVYQRKFKWYDAFHFVPALLFVANFWSFYSKSASEKLELIHQMYKGGYESIWSEGSFLPDNFTFILRTTPFIVYVIAMGIILFASKKSLKLSSSLKDFFTALLLYLSLNLISVILSDVLYLSNKNSVYETNSIGFITTFFMLTYFFFIPNFMYHPYFVKKKRDRIAQNNAHLKSATYTHLEKIEQYFNLHKSFLNPDYTITQLEREIKIPARQISKAIKLIRNQNFNQFLNEYRINYLVQHISVETAMKTNFQDLAYQVGFNSVNNFYAHFKNYVGCTPKTYFDNLKKSSITEQLVN
jgi:AraC-like DNA-binding protein